MKLSGLVCAKCGNDDIHAVSPGGEDVQADMFNNRYPIFRGKPRRGWCRKCWLKQYGSTYKKTPGR
jgi:hypothetical protein